MKQMDMIAFNANPNKIITRIFIALVLIELLIFTLDILFNIYNISDIGALRRLFNVTREDAIGNWFSCSQPLIISAITLLLFFGLKKQGELKGVHVWGWAFISTFFLYISFDDGSKFHERMGASFRAWVDSPDYNILQKMHESFPSYTWQVVLGPIFIVIMGFMLWFLWKEFTAKKYRWIIIGAFAAFGIAVGIDFIEGLDGRPFSPVAELFDSTQYQAKHFFKAVEETLEMFGTTLFLILFLSKLFDISNHWAVRIQPK